MGATLNGWHQINDTHAVSVRVYPSLPQQEVCIIRFLRISLPRGMDSTMERWNFKDMCWQHMKSTEVLSLDDGTALAVPPEALETFALEMLRAAVKVAP